MYRTIYRTLYRSKHSATCQALAVWLFFPLLVQAQETYISAAEVVGYGIFSAASESRARGFRENAVAADSVEGVRFINFTNRIPAEIGIGFGFEYVINTRPKGRPIEVTSVIRFPEPGIVRPKGQVYLESRESGSVKVGEPVFYGYGFDEEWELIPGEWVFEIWHKDARLVTKRFTVFDPDGES